jgi:hypothetical protein
MPRSNSGRTPAVLCRHDGHTLRFFCSRLIDSGRGSTALEHGDAVSDAPFDGPPLRPLHPDASLNPAKLSEMDRRATDVLQTSLLPGQKDCLQPRPDGTILDGHHRIYILRGRGVNVDLLAREIIVKEDF